MDRMRYRSAGLAWTSRPYHVDPARREAVVIPGNSRDLATFATFSSRRRHFDVEIPTPITCRRRRRRQTWSSTDSR